MSELPYKIVIGLEVHVQLATQSKLFCRCPAEYGAEPNANVCPVCLGLPGALPVLNRRAVELAALAARALGAEVHRRSVFARKNYFYPDLPKGYQISQYDQPFATGGAVQLEPGEGGPSVGLERIHLEEDAGKSFHTGAGSTLIDMNRCGVPLIEIVSKPEIHSPEQAHRYLSELRRVLMYIGICDGNMERGSLRCDANLSVRPKGSTALGTKTEIKNLNSFRGVERGLRAVIDHQLEVLGTGGRIVRQTMLWDAKAQRLAGMRTKEEAHDYRYFPEPDLPALEMDAASLDLLEREIPELPMARRSRFTGEYQLPPYDVEILASTRPLADYFEACARASGSPKAASNWILNELLREVSDEQVSTGSFPVRAEDLAELLNLMADGTISGRIAKEVFAEMVTTGSGPRQVVESKGLVQVTDESALSEVARQVIEEHDDVVDKIRGGKDRAIEFLVGQVMKKTRGRAHPGLVNRILRRRLGL